MPDLSQLHFLRPLWLLALIPTVWMLWQLHGRESAARQWGRAIAPHLLEHLTVGQERRSNFRPLSLLAAALALAILAAAGPTWEREPSPFSEDEAPLVVALALTPSMNAIDVQPTRLERAKQKIRDLLALREGARSGLLVYAGSAHMVLPLTDDPQILDLYLQSLEPEMMPVAGNDPAAALALAGEMLAPETAPGAILFVTDSFPEEHREPFVTWSQERRHALLALGVGTSEGGPIRVGEGRFQTDASGRRTVAPFDREGLETLAREADAWVTTVTVDDSDVRRLDRRIESHLVAVQSEDESVHWRDHGYYLVFPVAALALLWFRRGWTIQWAAGVLLLLMMPSPTQAQDSRLAGLWLTPDQQGRWLFERGEYAKAARHFEDPIWKGISFYAARDFEEAIDWFARLETPEAWFNLGNAYARAGNHEEAIRAYDEALARRPDWAEARENREYLETLIPAKIEPPADDHGGTGGQLGADEIVLDETGERTAGAEETMEVAGGGLSDEQIADLWMRRIQTTPADFLRSKFAFQQQAAEQRNGAVAP